MAFKIGQLVQLNSGGPIMTATALGKDAAGKPRVTCSWFDNQNNEKTAVYPVEALKAYAGEKGSTEGGNDDGGDFMTS